MIAVFRNLLWPMVTAWRGGCQTLETVLHFGAHRTASTTLQAFLEANSTTLAARGIGAWTPRRTRAGLFSGLIRRPQEITLQLEERAARSSGVIRIEVERLRLMGLSHLIVSEENMIGATRNNLRERILYPMLDERLIRFRRAFAESCTRVVMSIRAYEGYWASSLAYGVAQGDPFPDAGMLDRLVAQPRRWRDIIREVSQTFPNAEVLVWPFERFAGRPEAQLEIMTGQHVPAKGLTNLRDWRNPSPRLTDLRDLLDLRSDLGLGSLLPGGDGRWMPFESDHLLEMHLAYQSDLAWLRDGADGFARFVEDPNDLHDTKEITGKGEPTKEWSTAPDQRGHQDEGPKHAMV